MKTETPNPIAAMDRLRGLLNDDLSLDAGTVYADSLVAREALVELVEAARGIVGDKPDKWGYRAAANAMDDAKRARLTAALVPFGGAL